MITVDVSHVFSREMLTCIQVPMPELCMFKFCLVQSFVRHRSKTTYKVVFTTLDFSKL